MGWFVTHLVISAVLLPPMDLILPGVFGLLIMKKHPGLGKSLIAVTLGLFCFMSIPFFSDWAMEHYEAPYTPISGNEADAIVVLGGGSYFNAPEYGGVNTVSRKTLERLRYAAALHRRTGKPILVTGGHPLGNSDSEAAQMQAVLIEDFHVPVTWTENASANTEENATNSAAILKRNHIARIYLVSQAWHIPRAERMFEKAGLAVVAAPTGFITSVRTDILSFIPTAAAFLRSEILLHEIIGIAWFELKSSH